MYKACNTQISFIFVGTDSMMEFSIQLCVNYERINNKDVLFNAFALKEDGLVREWKLLAVSCRERPYKSVSRFPCNNIFYI